MKIEQNTHFEVGAAGLNATNKTNPVVAKMVAAWENENARRALKGSGLSLVALSLAACGSDSSSDAVSVTAVDAGLIASTSTTVAELLEEIKLSDNADAILAAVQGVNVSALTVQQLADLATQNGIEIQVQAVLTQVNEALGTTFDADDDFDDVLLAMQQFDNATVEANATTDALTDADGVEHDDVDDAITSNDTGIT